MSRKAVAVFSFLLLAGLLTHASASHAQVEDLVSFGTFADTHEAQTRLGWAGLHGHSICAAVFKLHGYCDGVPSGIPRMVYSVGSPSCD